MPRRLDQRGTTMFELVIYLALSSLVVLTMFQFISGLSAARVRTADQKLAQENARTVLARMTHALRNSKDVTVAADRINIEQENTNRIVFAVKDGTIQYAEKLDVPPAYPADIELRPLTDPGVVLDTATFKKISSSVQVNVQFKKGTQVAQLDSTIAYRQ